MADVVNFNTSEIDFDGIASSLKNYLSYQKEFTDYNFEGSALSTLINLLAYNTHYNIVYDNFALNEAFLDSAFKRESVISHASLINYLPRSAKASTAKVNINVYDDSYVGSGTSVLPKYSIFSSTINGNIYNFYTDSTYTFERDQSNFIIDNVVLKRGTYISIERVYSGNNDEKIVLDNENVDTDTITVRVQHNQTIQTFTKVENILDITSDSKVYFLSMNSRGKYQIQFGSGMLGYSLSAGDVVYVTYLSCGSDVTSANGANKFIYQGTLSNLGFSNQANMNVVCTSKASGGSEEESTESIRTLAPKIFTTQNRCITENDYKSIILHNFANAKSVNVWGGQKMNPPQYGKVFISIIPKQGLTLSEDEKNSIKNDILKDKQELTKIVEFIDPEYVNINVSTAVHIKSSATNNTTSDIETLVRKTIENYNDQNLADYGSVLRFSQLTKLIDNCETSIQNNITTIRLQIDETPDIDVKTSYTIDFHNPIYQPNYPAESVLSNGFICFEGGEERTCYIDDDPLTSKLRLFYRNLSNMKVILRNIGTINYQTGVLNIDPITIYSVDSNKWSFIANPASNDVTTDRNQFAVIDSSQIIIKIIDDDANTSYIQTNSK